MAQDDDSDSELVLLMVTTVEGNSLVKAWYLGIGCSNHMIGHKDFLVDLDTSRKTKIKLADSRTLVAEGVRNIVVKSNDGKIAIIENVLFVSGMKFNRMSVRQLIENGFLNSYEE